jgi:hypothetical protein
MMTATVLMMTVSGYQVPVSNWLPDGVTDDRRWKRKLRELGVLVFITPVCQTTVNLTIP